MPGDVRSELHLVGEETAGALFVLLDEPPPGWALPSHRHRNEAETIHVLRGRFGMTIDGRRTTVQAGETCHVPAGVVHSGGNLGEETGRRLVIFSPAGIEGFWLQVGRAEPGRRLGARETLAAAERWGWEFPREPS